MRDDVRQMRMKEQARFHSREIHMSYDIRYFVYESLEMRPAFRNRPMSPCAPKYTNSAHVRDVSRVIRVLRHSLYAANSFSSRLYNVSHTQQLTASQNAFWKATSFAILSSKCTFHGGGGGFESLVKKTSRQKCRKREQPTNRGENVIEPLVQRWRKIE